VVIWLRMMLDYSAVHARRLKIFKHFAKFGKNATNSLQL